jgi:ABC-type transport system involved in cytochrome c biogenesis permease subunit
MAVPLVAEPLIRHQNVMQSLRSVSVRLAVGEPLLIVAGFIAFLLAVRRRVPIVAVASVWRHVVAAFLAVVALGVTSVFAQGAHLPFIIAASVFAGAFAGGVMFGLSTRRPDAALSDAV